MPRPIRDERYAEKHINYLRSRVLKDLPEEIAQKFSKRFFSVTPAAIKKALQRYKMPQVAPGYDRPWDQARKAEKIQCLVCGHWFKTLTYRHLRSHGMTSAEYRKRFGLAVLSPLCCKEISENAKERAKTNGCGHLDGKRKTPSADRMRRGKPRPEVIAKRRDHNENGPNEKKRRKEISPMLTPDVLKHFGLVRDPFTNEIHSVDDVYMSDEYQAAEAMVLQCARYQGFCALCGEIGSGKTTLVKKVLAALRDDSDIIAIEPRGTVQKTRLTESQILDAIIEDAGGQKSWSMPIERKGRRAIDILKNLAAENRSAFLVIDEAQKLSAKTLILLKNFYELESGFRRLLGILLVGQGSLINNMKAPGMSEVLKRCDIFELYGLRTGTKRRPDTDVEGYLKHKFRGMDGTYNRLFDPSAIKALKRKVGIESPLTVNYEIGRALNYAFSLTLQKLTGEVIEAV